MRFKTASKTKNYEIAAGFTVLSALFVALLALFGKLGLAIDSITLLVFLRFFVPFLILLPFLAISGYLKELSFFKQSPSQLIRCLCVLGSQYCFFYYLKEGSLLNANLLLNTGPIFIPLLARIFYKQSIDRVTIFCIFLSLVGVIFILKPNHGIIDPKGIFGALSGLFMAGSQTIYGVNAKKEKQGVNLFYLFCLPSIFALPVVFFSGLRLTHAISDLSSWAVIWLILGISLSSIFNQIFRGFAYQRADAPSLAPFLYASTVIAALFDWTIFGVTPTLFTLIGFTLVLFASIYKIHHHRRQARSTTPEVK